MTVNPKAKATAAAFRKQLANTFPGTKFSVRLRLSGWLTVMSVQWVDGPTEKEIDELAKPLREREFDKNNDDAWNSIEGVDTGICMVETSRTISSDLRSQVVDFLSVTFDGWRFTHKDEFTEAIDHLWGNPKDWQELKDNNMALCAIVRWVAEGSNLVPSLAQMWVDCADF